MIKQKMAVVDNNDITTTTTAPSAMARAFTEAIEEFTPHPCIKFEIGTKANTGFHYSSLLNGFGKHSFTLKAGNEAFILIMKLYTGPNGDDLATGFYDKIATMYYRIEMQPDKYVIVDWRRTVCRNHAYDTTKLLGGDLDTLEYDSMSLALADLVDRAISADIFDNIGDKTKSACKR